MRKELIVHWKIKIGEVDKVFKLLPKLTEKSRKEEGNLLYSIYQKETDSSQLILHEIYKDEAAFNLHKESEHYQSIVLDQIIPLLQNREVHMISQIL